MFSQFPLTPEEIIERRKLLAEKGAPDRQKSVMVCLFEVALCLPHSYSSYFLFYISLVGCSCIIVQNGCECVTVDILRYHVTGKFWYSSYVTEVF